MTAVPDPQEALREQIARATHRTYCIYGSCTAANQRDHAIADAVLPVVQAHTQALEDARLMDLHSSCDERWREQRDAARTDLASLRDAVSRLADDLEAEARDWRAHDFLRIAKRGAARRLRSLLPQEG